MNRKWDELPPRTRWNALTLAESDLAGAAFACGFAKRVILPAEQQLQLALQEIAVIRYWRPFSTTLVASKGAKVLLPGKYTKSFTREEAKAHQRFRHLRNESFAHRDHSTVTFLHWTHLLPDPAAGAAIPGDTVRTPAMPFLSTPELELLSVMITKIRAAIEPDHLLLAREHGLELRIDTTRCKSI